MERDFEQEFRELKQSEIPDLWNRIEAGLSEKNAVILAPQPIPQKKSAWRKWGTLAAACLCVVIILPAFSLLIRNKGFSGGDMSAGMESEPTAYNTAMEYASDNAAAEEMSEDVAEEMPDDMAAAENMSDGVASETEEMAPGQENGMTDRATTTDAGGTDSAASPGESAAGAVADTSQSTADMTSEESSVKKENTQKEEADRADAEEKAVWDELSDGQILEEAVVQIQKADVNGSETLYQVSVVQEDADGLLKTEAQIVLVCNDDTAYDFPVGLRDRKKLKEQETYQVNLCYDEEEGRFVVVTAGSVE